MQPRSKRRFWNSPIFLYPAVALIAIGAAATGYYLLRINTRQADLDEEDFRLLASISDELRSRISNIGAVLRNLNNRNAAIGAYLTAQAPELTDCGRGAGTSTPEFSINPSSQEYGGNRTVQNGPLGAGWLFSLRDNRHCLQTGVDVTMQPLLGAARESFDDVLLADRDGKVIFQMGSTGIRITGLDAIFDFGNPAQTDSIEHGKESQSSGASDANPGLGGSPNGSRVKTGSDFRDVRQYSNVSVHELGGEDFRVYLSPVGIPSSGSAAGHSGDSSGHDASQVLILCGLVRKDRFRADMLAPFGPSLLTVITVVTIIITGSWPVLKFASRRRTERVRRPAAVVLVLSTLSAVILLSFLILDLQDQSMSQPNDRLAAIAGQIDRNLAAETWSAFGALTSATRLLTGELTQSPAQQETADSNGRCYGVPYCRTDLLKADKYLIASYPWLDIITWFDRCGKQVHKWSVRSTVTPELNGRGYPYFDETVLNHTWTFHDHPDFRFRIDPLYSPNTGEYLAILTRPIGIEERHGYYLRTANVAAPLASLIYPVLPPDYGFAIIDPDGTVLFHSDSTRNQRERFYQQFRNPDAVRSAVDSDSAEPFTAEYHGRNYLFRASRLAMFDNCPWTLVVFADTDAAHGWHFERMLLAGALTLFHIGIIVILGLLVSLILPDYPVAWIWPSTDRKGVYIHLACVYGVIFGAAAVWVFRAYVRSDQIFLVVEAGTVATFLVTVLKLRGHNWSLWLSSLGLICLSFFAGPDQFEVCLLAAAVGMLPLPWATSWLQNAVSRISREGCFAAAGAALVLPAACAPCMAFFKLAYDFEQMQQLKNEQMVVFERLAERSERVARHYQVIDTGGGLPEGSRFDPVRALFLKRRLLDCDWDRYDLAGQKEVARHEQSAWRVNLDRGVLKYALKLTALIPNKPAEIARKLNYEQSEDGNWAWINEGPTRLRLTRKNVPGGSIVRIAREDIDFQPESLAGTFNRLDLPASSSWGWCFFLSAGAGLFVWLRFTVQRLFITGIEQCSGWAVMPFPDSAACAKNRIFLGRPWAGKTAELATVNVSRIDLARAAKGEPVDFESLTSPVVALDHFEYQIEDAGLSARKFALLEYLLFQNKKIWIVTNTDPKFFFDQAVTLADDLQQGDTSDIETWRSLLATFDIVRLPCVSTSETVDLYPILWSSCTFTERIVLYQLAKDGWVNDRNTAALKHLLQNGLIEYNSGFRFSDEHFRKYVLGCVTSETVRDWEKEEGPRAWDGLKIVLVMVMLALLLAALLFAQQQFLALLTGSISTLVTGIKVVSELRGKSGGGNVEA